MYKGERLVVWVDRGLMVSKRLMLDRLDAGLEVTVAGTGMRLRADALPLGQHVVVTSAEGGLEYHLTRDRRKDKRGDWRVMTKYELGSRRGGDKMDPLTRGVRDAGRH